jgi:exonuclease VII small subunit
MTPAECVALRELEAAEQAVKDAVQALEAARERVSVVTRRETHRERAKTRARAHLRLVRAAR